LALILFSQSDKRGISKTISVRQFRGVYYRIIKASSAIEQIRAEVKTDLRAELGEVATARDGNDESRAAGVESCPQATRRSGKGAIPLSESMERLAHAPLT